VDGGIGAMIISDRLSKTGEAKRNQIVINIAASPSVFKRLTLIAWVVCVVLSALKHGDKIVASDVDAITLLKICLTF